MSSPSEMLYYRASHFGDNLTACGEPGCASSTLRILRHDVGGWEVRRLNPGNFGTVPNFCKAAVGMVVTSQQFFCCDRRMHPAMFESLESFSNEHIPKQSMLTNAHTSPSTDSITTRSMNCTQTCHRLLFSCIHCHLASVLQSGSPPRSMERTAAEA